MKRGRLEAIAFAAALAACGTSNVTKPGAGLREPVSVASFLGYTSADAVNLKPYFAIANQGRHDLTIVDATNDVSVPAPVELRTLVVSVPERPTILVSSSLGDTGADLLVAVGGDSSGLSPGNSSLQLVRTWDAYNQVETETVVDGEVLAAVAVPSAIHTARIALALSGHRVAVMTYGRSNSGVGPGIEPAAGGPVVSAVLPFQPVALAADPGDASALVPVPVPGLVYAATPDELPGSLFGVAEIDVSGATPAFVRGLDARGPTRLVAAGRLRERVAGRTATNDEAFDSTLDRVSRVYAVLDESGCGPSQRIDCGVAVIDARAATAGGTGTLLPDPTGRMPYLAPIRLPSRVLSLAVAPPPAAPPATTGDDAIYSGSLMRLWPGTGKIATTAVAAAACEDGSIHFIDLGRWNLASNTDPMTTANASLTLATATALTTGTVRLSLADAGGTVLDDATIGGAGFQLVPSWVAMTPGWAQSENFTVAYQDILPGLSSKWAEAGLFAPGQPWLAMQVAGRQVVRLWDPALGVRAGDIVSIEAQQVADLAVSGAPACVGTESPGAEVGTTKVFEARVAEMLQPSAAYPGGAVRLARETMAPLPAPAGDALSLWGDCFDRLAAATAAGAVTGLEVTVRAADYLVSGSVSGYLGRAVPGTQWTFEYPAAGEDSFTSCSLVPWPSNPTAVTCDATCRQACDSLLLARKARRYYHLATACPVDPLTCGDRFPGTYPDLAGPVVSFKIALATTGGAAQDPIRGLRLNVSTLSGVSPYHGPPTSPAPTGLGSLTHPNGVFTFDRSPTDGPSGYRFLVPYAADFVVDTTPSLEKASAVVIR